SLSKQVETCYQGKLRILRKLDTRQVWKGQWLLRRKAYGYMHHSCSIDYSDAACHWKSLARVVTSLWWYPLPFHREEVRTTLERPKRLLVELQWLLGLRAVAPTAELERVATDALERLKAFKNSSPAVSVSRPSCGSPESLPL